jgi:hypothetical protein
VALRRARRRIALARRGRRARSRLRELCLRGRSTGSDNCACYRDADYQSGSGACGDVYARPNDDHVDAYARSPAGRSRSLEAFAEAGSGSARSSCADDVARRNDPVEQPAATDRLTARARVTFCCSSSDALATRDAASRLKASAEAHPSTANQRGAQGAD